MPSFFQQGIFRDDSSAQPLKTLLDYLKGNEIIFIEEGDEVEKEAQAFSHLIQRTL